MILDDKEYKKRIKLPNSILICLSGEPKYFDDNLIGKCDNCGCDIYFRPFNKDATKKICTECALRPTNAIGS